MNLGIETETLEFKKSTSELKEACVSIGAILNKHSVGTLYFGVKSNGDIVGQDISEKSLRDVSQKISQSVRPQIYPVICKEEYDGKSIIKVEFSGNEKPYSANGRYYLRVADEDKEMAASKLRKFFLEHASFSDWEKAPSTRKYKDIDRKTLKRFVENAITAGRLPKGTKPDINLLRKLGLMEDLTLNNAGALLFAKDNVLTLKMAIFATGEKLTFLDIVSEEDNILNLLIKAEQYVTKNIRWKVEIIGMQREETPEIPIEAVREVIANSFAHAIYSSNTFHEICIHPNMVTVYNPGPFANSHKPEDYVKKNIASVIRNELIAKTLYLNRSIEQFGSGFKRIDSLCNDAGVKYTYEDSDQGFKFIFHRIGDFDVPNNVLNKDVLTSTERTVYQLICKNPHITKAEIATQISKTPRTVQRAYDSLRDKGYIEREGSTRSGHWIVK